MNNLDTKTNCPVCNKKRSLRISNVVFKQEGSVVIYNKCPHCASAFLAIVSGNGEGGLVVAETLTDLSYKEALKMSKRTKLTADNILDIYQKMQQ